MSRPELSRPLAVDAVPAGGRTVCIEARPEERRALARRFGLLSLDRLEARLTLSRRQGGRLLAVEGEIAADVVQECVITLEPVPATVAERVEELFTLAGGAPTHPGAEVEVALDAPEPLEGDVIDLGEIAAQCLLLALDPYPRSPSALQPAGEAGPGEATGEGPFAGLARLRQG
jgi:uncharacterized metal-binding protein YceD (DUF177 family)